MLLTKEQVGGFVRQLDSMYELFDAHSAECERGDSWSDRNGMVWSGECRDLISQLIAKMVVPR